MRSRVVIVLASPPARAQCVRALATDALTLVTLETPETPLDDARHAPALLIVDADQLSPHSDDGLQALRRRFADTPILLLTRDGDIPHAVRALHAGIGGCLEKSTIGSSLRRQVDRLLGSGPKPCAPANSRSADLC